MHFRSAERGVFSEYPVQPYSNTMYAGVLDEALVLLKGAGSEGFYADSGGYGWYYNGDTNKSIDMVFAPGGGQRITYYVTDANYQTIFDKVVKGKKPATKETVKAAAEKAGGKETSGKSVASSSSAGSSQASKATVAAGGTPAPALSGGSKFWEQSWFLPTVGGLTVAAVLAIAFWPSPKAKPLRSNRRKMR